MKNNLIKKKPGVSNARFIYLPLIIVLTFLIYSNTLDNEFQLDDNHVVLNNEKIIDLNNFAHIKAWQRLTFSRQFAYLTVAANYAIHGYEVFGYHLFNIVVHIINALLVFRLVLLLFCTHVLQAHRLNEYKFQIAFFSALLFAVHPVQIQAVAYITQRMVSLAVLFYLVSVILYLMMRLKMNAEGINSKTILYLVGIFISFQMGNYSKEITASLPLALILIETIFIRKPSGKPDFKIISLMLVGIAIVFAAVLLKGLPKQSGSVDRDIYFLTQLNVLTTYLRITFLPVNLHVFYDYRLSESFFQLKTIFSTLLLATILATGIFSYKKHPVVSFAIFWFFITQIIESSIFPLQYVIFEYRLYPSIIGFSFAVSFYTLYFFRGKIQYGYSALAIITILLSVVTYHENNKWQNGGTLWENNIAKAPKHAKPYNYLGHYFLYKGEYNKALPNFTRSIELDSTYTDPLNHRGIVFKETGRFREALNDFNKAIEINPGNKMSFNNRGYAYQALGEYGKAVVDFKKAIELYPEYHNAMKNLSVVLQKMNQFEEALNYAKAAIYFEDKIADYFNNRGNAFYSLGILDSAEADFKYAVQLDPKYYRGWNNIGVVYMKLGKYDEAINYFSKTIELKNNFIDAYFNRAYCLYNTRRITPALQDLQKCFELDSSHQGARSLYQKIFDEYSGKTSGK